MLGLLAGMGLGLGLMSNPRRRRRRSKRRSNPGGWWAHYKEGSGAWRVERVTNHAVIEQAHRDGWQIVFGDTREAALRALTREAKLRGVELAQRTNPAMPEGYDARGTRYKLKRKAETREWVLVAYVNGKRHEGRTLYFDDRKDAEDTLRHITGQHSNPATYWWYREVRYDRDGEPTKSWRQTNDAVMAASAPAKATASTRWKRGGAVDPSIVARDIERAGAARALRSNPMRIVGARPAISRAKAKKIAAEYGITALPKPGREVLLFKYGRYDTQVWLANYAGTFIVSDHGAISDPITAEVASKLGIRTNPRRRRRRK